MSEQNKATTTATPVELPAKRKRGRPRKDGNLLKKPTPQPPVAPALESTKKIQSLENKPKESNGGNIVGKIVTGVIDGTFEAGFFITVKIGNNGTPLRGVVFQPGRYSPITVENDVAPQAKAYELMPVVNPEFRVNGVGPQAGKVLNQQSDPSLDTSMRQNSEFGFNFQSESTPPVQNLRMVEQDEVMQVFEVSTPSAGVNLEKDAVLESSSDPRANLLIGENVQNQGVGSRIESDSFEQHELNQSYLELLQNSIGSSSQSVIQKVGSVEAVEAVESHRDEDQLICNELKSQELHQATGVSKPQPEMLVDIELNNPILDLHEIPVVSQTQSVGEDLKAAESELQDSERIQNDPRSSNITLNDSSIVAQGPHTIESKLQPSEFGSLELNRSNLELESEVKNQDLQLHQSPVVEKNHLEPNKLIHNTPRNPNVDLFGESQFLELIHEPMDFMMERPSSPKNITSQVSQLEHKANEVRDNDTSHNEQIINAAHKAEGCSQSAPLTDDTPYKLELSLKDSTPGSLE